jgi:hypothetical protein
VQAILNDKYSHTYGSNAACNMLKCKAHQHTAIVLQYKAKCTIPMPTCMLWLSNQRERIVDGQEPQPHGDCPVGRAQGDAEGEEREEAAGEGQQLDHNHISKLEPMRMAVTTVSV